MSLCRKHISQYSRHGKFFECTIYDKNKYIENIIEGYAEIILRDKNNNEVGKAIIDIDCIEKCKEYKWHMRKSRNTNYVACSINGKKLFLYRLILEYTGKMDVDHINHNGLDNRKLNLRICTHSQNMTNQYKKLNGIYKTKSGKYRASICINSKTIYIGTFETEEEALFARANKEKELFN